MNTFDALLSIGSYCNYNGGKRPYHVEPLITANPEAMLQFAVTSMWRALCLVIYHPAQLGISGVHSSSCPLVSADYPCRVPRRFLLIHRILSKDGFALRLYFLLHIPSSFYTSSLEYYKIQGPQNTLIGILMTAFRASMALKSSNNPGSG